MKLREFVETALMDVLHAVGHVQNQTQPRHGGPRIAVEKQKTTQGGRTYEEREWTQATTTFEFDVAVSSLGESSDQKGIGVLFGAIGAGTQAKTRETDSAVTRLKFTIPVTYPNKYEPQEQDDNE